MKLANFQTYQSKTISTSPSIHLNYKPAIHNYHQYESLLHYMTSFITDFKLNIVELKQLIYSLVGIAIPPSPDRSDHSSNPSKTWQYCQVEFMMHSCRKARQDIIRIVSIMRGYSKAILTGSNYLLEQQLKLYNQQPQKQNLYPPHNNMSMNIEFKENLENCLNENQEKKTEEFKYNDIGFLTFRDNIIEDKNSGGSGKKFGVDNYMIVEENLQTSRSKTENNRKSQGNKSIQKMNLSGKQSLLSRNSTSEQFGKVFELINLIRSQINHPQHKPRQNISQDLEMKTQQTERTATLTNDSPMIYNYQQEA